MSAVNLKRRVSSASLHSPEIDRSVITTAQTSVTATDSSSTAEDANLDAEPSISQRERVPKINTSSLVELKNTCDDVVKEVSLNTTSHS